MKVIVEALVIRHEEKGVLETYILNSELNDVEFPIIFNCFNLDKNTINELEEEFENLHIDGEEYNLGIYDPNDIEGNFGSINLEIEKKEIDWN